MDGWIVLVWKHKWIVRNKSYPFSNEIIVCMPEPKYPVVCSVCTFSSLDVCFFRESFDLFGEDFSNQRFFFAILNAVTDRN